MKNTCLLLLATLLAFYGNAQTGEFNYPDAFYFVKQIKTKGMGDRPFHIEITVKENPADSLSKPRIYAVQVRAGKEDIIGKSLVYAKVSNGEWNTYSIDGIVNNEATRIWFYAAVNGNGNFYFDKLQFSAADASGTLQEKDITNPSFEDKKLLKGYFVSALPSKNLRLASSSVSVDGKKSLQVTVTGQKPAGLRSVASK